MRKVFYKILFSAFWLSALTLNAQQPIDPKATTETRNLLINLHEISKTGFLFGHQDDMAYGVGWVATKGRSDVKETAGSYPAVQGWDVGSRLTNQSNIDDVRFDNMKRWVAQAYKRGSINTFSWHLDNLTTGSNSWDRTPSVQDILPGGSRHAAFLEQLDLLSVFFSNLKSGKTQIPIIFRPWHEHNGDWFWWGKGNCSEEEYRALFRFTVDYLKNEKGLHHLLYAFSPDRSRLKMDSTAYDNYFWGYPGDEYVDIIGIDNYGDVGRIGGPDSPETQRKNFVESLQLITQIAQERGKVAALTETGLEGVTNPNWYTQILLEPLIAYEDSIKLAWVLVWRNANTTHHYAPYPGHSSEADFKLFESAQLTYFEKNLKKPYKKGKALKK